MACTWRPGGCPCRFRRADAGRAGGHAPRAPPAHRAERHQPARSIRPVCPMLGVKRSAWGNRSSSRWKHGASTTITFRRWARTARLAAAEVDDPTTTAWVLAQEAYGHFYGHDLAEAVAVARQAQDLAGRSVGSALAAALEARAHAVRGDPKQTHKALAQAEETLGFLDCGLVRKWCWVRARVTTARRQIVAGRQGESAGQAAGSRVTL